MPTPLPLITTLARSGALDRAWTLFEDGGYAGLQDDASALGVKGRLLKDRAFKVERQARHELLKEAAAAYAAADAIEAQPYLLINAASCRALAGDMAAAKAAAAEVLDRIDPGKEVAETPYWIAATRAEALLIKGDHTAADEALLAAMSADPTGYEDHASTLRQFSRLLKAMNLDDSWLNRHRPPVSLHFAGHLGIADGACMHLRDQVDALLDQERVGFGYGALAAGSDIVIAEALLARGAELHVVLPAPAAEFIALSVSPYGQGWVKRFEACLAKCHSVHVAAQVDREHYEPLATALAAELAMGAALLNARRLESYAQQLLVVDGGDGPFGGGRSTARDGQVWTRTGQAQHLIVAERTAAVQPSSEKKEGRQDLELKALLRLDFAGLDRLGDADFAAVMDDEIDPLLARAASIAPQPSHKQPHGNARVFAFANPALAASFARQLMALGSPQSRPLAIAGHYGLVIRRENALMGPGLSVLDEIAEMTVEAGLTVSDAFATALQLGNQENAPDAQYVGDYHSRHSAFDARLFTLSV